MVKYDFTGKVGIITGAGVGIGFEIAKMLCMSGAEMVINDIDESLALTAVEGINKIAKKSCVGYSGDASDIAVIKGLVNAAANHFSRLDFVIANAGITTFGDFLNYPEDQFRQLVSVNLHGSFFLAQQGASLMKSLGINGKILFMSSVTAHQAHPNLSAYGMTKAALEALARNLAVELGSLGITVNSIAPGATITERTIGSDPNYLSSWEKITPSGKVTTTKDVALLALYLLSDASNQITGQSIIIDGGWTSVSPPPQ